MMNSKFLLLTLILLTGAATPAFAQRQRQQSTQTSQTAQLTRIAQNVSGDTFSFENKTPNGARVFSVNRPNAAMLQAIDDGLTDLFEIAEKNGYTRRLNYSDYTIYIARPDRAKDSNGNYSPDIAVGAEQYAGSTYDQGGFVYAAGMVIAFTPSAFVIAEHTKNLSRVTEVVRYEGEHIVLYHNDRRRFDQTRDHSKGGGHPILQ